MSKKTCRKLLKLLSDFSVVFWCADNFSAYDRLLDEKHITGKFYIDLIKRENLNLRNRLKCKTLGYSQSTKRHDKLIGTFIECNIICYDINQHIEYTTSPGWVRGMWCSLKNAHPPIENILKEQIYFI